MQLEKQTIKEFEKINLKEFELSQNPWEPKTINIASVEKSYEVYFDRPLIDPDNATKLYGRS